MKKTVLEELGFRGRVRSCIVETFSAVGTYGSAEKTFSRGYKYYAYNEEGAPTLEVNSEGYRDRYRITYTYGEDGRVVKTTRHFAFDGGSNVDTFTYDERGNLVCKERRKVDGSSVSKDHFIYDKKGRPIETVYYDENSKVVGRHTISYDEDNNIVRESKFDANGMLEEEICDTFSGETKVECIKMEYQRDGSGYKERTTYNNSGQVTMIESYRLPEDTISSREVHIYDEKNNLTEIITYECCSDGMSLVSQMISYRYDDKGEMVEEALRSSDGSFNFSNTFVYSYDELGNWIRLIAYRASSDGEYIPDYIIERRIEYYP